MTHYFRIGVTMMALSEDTKGEIKNTFGEILDLLDIIEVDPDEDTDEEALKYVTWMKQKLEIRYGTKDKNGKFQKKQFPSFPLFPTGIYWAHLGVNVGSEENKHRPVLILRASRNQEQCTVLPLSTQRLNDGIEFHVDLTEFDNTALIEHLRIISKKRIDKPMRTKGGIAKVSEEKDLKEIYEQIAKYYATRPPKPKKKN